MSRGVFLRSSAATIALFTNLLGFRTALLAGRLEQAKGKVTITGLGVEGGLEPFKNQTPPHPLVEVLSKLIHGIPTVFTVGLFSLHSDSFNRKNVSFCSATLMRLQALEKKSIIYS